jgi:hypothetical protein
MWVAHRREVRTRQGHPVMSLPALVLARATPRGGIGRSERSPDFSVRGTDVVVESSAPFARAPDFPERVESTLGAALSYWGGRWSDLHGMVVTFSDEESVPCGGSTSALGCYDGDIRLTTADPGVGTFECVEQTVLVHEVGHAVIGDPRHEDPRWMQMDQIRDALSGRRGYRDAGPTDCAIAVSVWRHPPNDR